MNSATELGVLTPEFIMAIGGMALMIGGVFAGDQWQRLLNWCAIALLLAALAVLLALHPRATAFNGSFIADAFAEFVKVLVLAGAALVLFMGQSYVERQNLARYEFSLLVVFSALGMMLMASAGDFITLYLSIELQSLALYVLAAFDRDNLRSTESGLKYFILGALSSGMMLYGISLIYGFGGTVSFAKVAALVHVENISIGLIFGLVFLISGLAFKVAAVPFHMWTPDVYEGAPTPITAFFSASPKIAAMALFVRAMVAPFPGAIGQWRQIIILISILSMALGAVAAIGQMNIKRLMAYSSIANMGYVLIGLAAGTTQGVQGVLLYLAIYLVTTIGTFACILAMRRGGHMVENISDLAGLAQTHPGFAFVFAMLMFSLAGIPPLAGFFAKFYVFLAAINAGLYPIAVIGVLASVVGAYYYLRIVKIIYFDEPAPSFDSGMGWSIASVITGSGIFTLFFVIGAPPLVQSAGAAAQALFPVTVPDWPKGIGLCRHEILDSTNEEAKRLARRGERGPLWITALQQTAGRGRHGREWVSESGNLFATLLIAVAQQNSPQIAFIAGIAATDVCARYVPRESVKLKWPNDVLVGGRKAAGVLVEQVTDRLVAAGIGIDLAHCPAGIGAVSIAGIAGFAPDPGEVLPALAHGMNEWLILWREHGFDPVRRAWLNRAGGIGKSIRAVTAQACFDGIFESLDNDGALLLRDGAGASHRITAADVFYGG